MLTDEEIKAVALKAVGESKAGQAFVSIIAKACHVVLTLDKQMAKPTPKSRAYDVGDILRSREDRSVTIRLVSLLNEGYWWVSSKSDTIKGSSWVLHLRALDSDYEPVPAEDAKPAPAPARKHWPKGPFTVVLDNYSDLYRIECGEPIRLCCDMYKSQAEAIAVALAEFPIAVAWIREHGTMQSGEQLDRYIARRDALLARVDEAGFDLSITGEAK